MNIEEVNMRDFFTQISATFSKNSFRFQENDISKEDLINNKECFYIFDIKQNKVIYHNGFQNLLGFYEEDISLEFILEKYHPDDLETVNRIAKATILHCLSTPFQCKDSTLQITFRIINNGGSYKKVLSQSTAFQINKRGIMTHILVKLVDISFLEIPFCVNWYFHAKDLDVDAFRNQIYNAYNDFFTIREKEIIVEIEKGLTSKLIAKKFNISKHTIATHRKNILKKAGRHNTKDLILFCKRRGVL